MPFLQFKGKTAVESYHRVVPHHALEIDRKLSLAKEPSLDGNLIIEGDNLVALKSLLPTHAGRIKCIYIDPPYNTGDEGWIYNDNLTQPVFKEWIGKVVGKEGEDATRHDKWCCMMYPRLQLLKEMLRDDGVIIVSIDDNELHNARTMLAEVFGEENFIECVVWEKSYGGGAKSKHFVRLHEYVLCFAKNKSNIGRLTLPPDPAALKYYTHKDAKFKTRGPYRTQPLWTNSMDERKRLRYAIPYKSKEVWPEKQWQWSKDRAMEALADDELVFVETEAGVSVYYKQYLRDEEGRERGAKPYSVLEGIYTQHGTEELDAIFGGKAPFKFPKPSELVAYFLRVFTGPGDVVLDSFAGSGTVGHAVLRLNSEEGEGRQFVLIQMAKDGTANQDARLNIARDVTRERVARVVHGYKQKDGKQVTGLGGEFTYVRVGRSMFDEYRDLGDEPPSYEQLARYIWFTETSRNFDPSVLKPKSWLIGKWQETSYYLLYRRGRESPPALDAAFLRGLKDKSPRKVIYCESLWLHREDLNREEMRREFGEVRVMQLPFQLK